VKIAGFEVTKLGNSWTFLRVYKNKNKTKMKQQNKTKSVAKC
jgi:hypothetical protein